MELLMTFSIQRATSDGTLSTLDLTIEYIDQIDVHLFVDDVEMDLTSGTTPYTWEWVTPSQIKILPVVPNGSVVMLRRRTQSSEMYHNFYAGAVFKDDTVDENFKQVLFLTQESQEGLALTDLFNDLDMHGFDILNLPDATNPKSPVTLAQLNAYAADSSAVLRQDLAAPTGTEEIGRGASTLESSLNAIESDVTALEVDVTAIESAQGKEAMFTNSSVFVGSTQAAAVLCIGDSNSAGNGQPYGFGGSLMGRTIRSIMNSYDHGIGMDRGYMYESLLALSQELIPARGFSGNGGFVFGPSPALDDRFQLDPGEILTLTGREIAQLQLWYDPALSSGDFTITVDGVTANAHTVGGSGTTGSFALAAGGAYISPASTVTITSTTGTKVITGVQAIRKGGSLSPLVYAAPKGSQGFSDFSAPAVVTDLAAIVNSSSAPARKLIMVLLGTNNMISTVGKQLTPAAYISALDALIVAYKAALGGDSLCNFAVWVPPQPLEALPLGTYQQYVDAIVAYCEADPRISCIRMDKTVLNTADFYTDTLHLNEVGHIIAAQTICRTLGVELDARFPVWSGISQTTALAEGVLVPNGTWAAGSAAVRKDLTGRVFMRGSMSKAAGSGVALLGTLPAAFRPSGATRLVVVADDQGVPRGLTIATSGAVTLVIADPLPVQGVFFDGVSFDL